MVQFGGLKVIEPCVCFSRCKCELYCDERAAKIPLGIEEAEPQVTPPFPTQKPFSLSAEIQGDPEKTLFCDLCST